MPRTLVIFYQDPDGNVPLLGWFKKLPEDVLTKCQARLELLRQFGHELRRPVVDYLGDDIYELRTKCNNVNYRILYFFHGRNIIVISHGLSKEKAIPKTELKHAIMAKDRFETNPSKHSYFEERDERKSH